MSKISVIMPSLNVQSYIRSCIESVLNQSFADIEILAIDAGSTDGTLEILEEYAAEDDRICIIHSEQKSYGYQVNLGIKLAQGEYIGIVETDDMIAENMYEILYKAADADDLEYVKCGFSCFVESVNGLRWYQKGGRCFADKNIIGEIISPKDMPELAIQDYYLWAGIYRKKFLKEIRLSETPGAAFQDTGFIYQVLSLAGRAVYLNDELYYYRQSRGNSSFDQKGFQYLIREYANLERILPMKSDEWVQAYYARMFRQMIGRFQRMAINEVNWKDVEDDIKTLQNKMKQAERADAFSPGSLGEENRKIYYRLQENAYNIFCDERMALAPKIEKLRALLDHVANRKIVIFGCGQYGRYMHVLLESFKPGQVCVFCDNNESIWHTSVQGVEVIAPSETVAMYPNAEYVTANLKGWLKIREQLLVLGIKEQHIYRYEPDFDIRLFLI